MLCLVKRSISSEQIFCASRRSEYTKLTVKTWYCGEPEREYDWMLSMPMARLILSMTSSIGSRFRSSGYRL